MKDPKKFVELMEKYDIKPRDLGITSRYKMMIRKGERKPSRELVVSLVELVNQRIERVVAGPRGFEPRTSGLGGRRSILAELRAH